MAYSTVSSTITVTLWLCACTELLVQHSLTDYNKQQPYTVYCWC